MTIDEYLHGPDRKVIQGFADRRVQQALQTYQENHPDDKALLERVQRLENAARAKIKALELDRYIERRCVEAGMDYALLSDIPFRDREAVDAKVAQLKDVFEKKRQADVNRMLLSGHKPGSGNAPERDVAKLSRSDAVQLEESGNLNDLLQR